MKMFSGIFSLFGKTSKRKTRTHIKRKSKTRKNRAMKGG